MTTDSPYTIYKSLLPRIAALGEEMARNARTKPLTPAPRGVVRVAAGLLRDMNELMKASGAVPAKTQSPGATRGFSRQPVRQRGHLKMRVPRNTQLTFAELSVLLGQARAALEAYGERHKLNRERDPRRDAEVEKIKRTLAERIDYIHSREKALREIEAERARQGLPPLAPEAGGGI